MDVSATLTRGLFMGLRLADVPGLTLHMRFAALRRRYYDLFWHRAAAEIGASIHKWDAGFQRLTRDGVSIPVHGAELGLDSHLTLRLMGNKAITYGLMAERGVAVPRHVRFAVPNLAPAFAFLEANQRPLVVKPNSGTGGGRGVTTGITTRAGLRAAALWAARFDIDLIAEEQIEGHSYRLLFLDGQFLDAVRRDPPRVTGNGRHCIARLMKDETRRRLKGLPFTALSPLQLDSEAKCFLASQGLSPRSVPAAGETVIVKRAANENSATENAVVTAEVHPATIALCARLSLDLGVRLAGIDIIARDIAKPLGPANGLIGEVNTTPGLHHHDLVSSPRCGPSVAARILEHMLETGTGVIGHRSGQRPAPSLQIAAA